MSWQLWIGVYMVLSTAFALVYRRFASTDTGSTTTNNLLMYALAIMPGGVIFGIVLGGVSFSYSWVTWLQFALGGVLFASATNLSYIANKGVDAAKIGVLGNLTSIVGILLASILLNETLDSRQLIGVALVMIAATGITLLKRKPGQIEDRTMSLIAAVIAPIFMGIALVNQKHIFDSVNLASYSVIAWPASTIVLFLFARAPVRDLSRMITRSSMKKLIGLGLMRAAAGTALNIAIIAADNASLISAVTVYRTVFVVIGSMLILRELDNVKPKLAAAVLATFGLILLL